MPSPEPPTPAQNSSFSSVVPGMQLGLDSTSLGEFKTCPRKYQLSIVEGWQKSDTSPHLTFGLHLHRAREVYDHQRLAGAEHPEALREALRETLVGTWDQRLRRPWVSFHSTKNRQTLVQTVVWYLDVIAQNDPMETLRLANGRAAVELSFRFDSGFATSWGEPIQLCGHIDRIGLLSGVPYIVDIKTSGSDVTKGWWAEQFTPGNQFSLYTIAGKVAFGVEVQGVIADGVQVGVTFARFYRHPIQRTAAGLEEWMRDLGQWVAQMEIAASAQHWPMNDTACDKYGGCPFREVCSKPPGVRDAWLRSHYVKRVWDPLQPRGDQNG